MDEELVAGAATYTTQNKHTRIEKHARSEIFFSILLYSVLHPCFFLCIDCPAFCLLSFFYNTNICAPGGIRTRNSSMRSAADPRLRYLGRWTWRDSTPRLQHSSCFRFILHGHLDRRSQIFPKPVTECSWMCLI